MAGTFAICKDCSGQFRFWLKSRNGEIVAVAVVPDEGSRGTV